MASRLSKLILAASLLYSSLLTVQGQSFTAANKARHLKRRDLGWEPRHDDLHLYFTTDASAPNTLGAKVTLEPHHPTLILDDISDLFNHVTCDQGRMHMTFSSHAQAYPAKRAWAELGEFTIVTSSPECAPHGFHQAYSVASSEFSAEEPLVVFEVEAMPLKERMRNMHVELGSHFYSHTERPQNVRARQVSSTDEAQASATPTRTISGAPSATADIMLSMVSETIVPPSQELLSEAYGIASLSGVAVPPDNMEVKCNNCTATGKVELIAGGFDVNDNFLEVAAAFFSDGFLQFNTSRIQAMAAIELAFLPGFSLANFEPLLPIFSLPPVTISDVIEFDVGLFMAIPMSVTLNSQVNISTGFTVDVPHNSTIWLDLQDASNSYVRGFNHSKVRTLPFSVNADDLSFNFGMGLRPTLAVRPGAKISERISLDGDLSVDLDLPFVSTNVTALSNRNGKCERPRALDETFDHVVHISSEVILGANAAASLTLDVDFANSTNYAKNLSREFGTDFPLVDPFRLPLPTRCLKLDRAGTGLLAATATEPPPTPTSTSGSDKSATSEAAAPRAWSQTNAFNMGMGLLGAAMMFNVL